MKKSENQHYNTIIFPTNSKNPISRMALKKDKKKNNIGQKIKKLKKK